ncbi:uncharacterized protein LOC130243017 isoform X2 [Danio aesculapii]|nr:uncharacterized protein LOC130243017 isoform X2 [Danio aesculapii]
MFPYNASICEHAGWRKSFPTDAAIGRYRNQLCSIEANFGADFSCVGNQLLLKKAKSTDLGTYVFICNKAENQLKLDVLYALKVNAVERADVTLDCTAALSDKDVTWLFNNGTALHYEKGGLITPGKGFEGRVSLEKDSFRTGDFSLTITNLRSADEGVYRCFVDQETTKGYPHTYKLDVNKNPEQTACPCTEASDHKTTTTIIILALSVVLLAICLLVLGILYYKACSQTQNREPDNTPTSETEHTPLNNNTANNHTPLIELSVQESSTMKPDSSVTTFYTAE